MARQQDIGKTSSFNNVNLMTARESARAPADGSSSQEGLRSMAELRGRAARPPVRLTAPAPGGQMARGIWGGRNGDGIFRRRRADPI